jgi:hypothetical protein
MYSVISVLFLILMIFTSVYYFTSSAEHFDDRYFPWNEANLVKKRHNSSVIDCEWDLSDDEFDTAFEVLRPYQHIDLFEKYTPRCKTSISPA